MMSPPTTDNALRPAVPVGDARWTVVGRFLPLPSVFLRVASVFNSLRFINHSLFEITWGL